jgi:hypothetical protein
MKSLDIVRALQEGKIKTRINSRTKGHQAEREIVNRLQDIVDMVGIELGMEVIPEVRRNLEQTRNGGHDILGVPGLAVEVKRHETLYLSKWWEQTRLQAEKVRMIPVLMYRRNHQDWKVIMESERWEWLLPSPQQIVETRIIPREREKHKLKMLHSKLNMPPLNTQQRNWQQFVEWLKRYLRMELDKKVELPKAEDAL